MAEAIQGTIRVSYDLLKELLRLPEDVKVLGIHGVDDKDGAFSLLIEMPTEHLKPSNLTPEHREDDAGTTFAGFRLSSPSGE